MWWGGVAVEGVGDGRYGVVGGVAVEGVGDGGCGGWVGQWVCSACCVHTCPLRSPLSCLLPVTVHHIHVLLLPHMMYGRGPYPR